MKLRKPGGDSDETIARVRGFLQGYVAANGKDVHVSAVHVLDLLNPRGMWSLDPGGATAEEAPPRSPTADPMTGCEPVTAPKPGL